ncbi:MAG: site-specific DNA-methyltransferase [Desulfovibrio piger]|uniref:site-specific DNA-methyltransferase n=1 Tax=Desulfovibrio piger TaxID=901 RepID=UPI00399A5C90
MPQQPRLELTWIGKDVRPRLEPRILLEDSEKSYHAAERHSDADIFDNMLIHGDNLLALKALEQDFSGKVKCIYIDPPYNTGSAFEHYDDGVEHSLWLSLMRDRLEILRNLLAEDGSLWVTLDDNEVHYFKVLCDEVFGRKNFIASIVWQSKDTPGNNSTGIAQMHNYILVFSKSDKYIFNLQKRNDKQLSNYSNPDNDLRGPWLATPLTRTEFRKRDYYPLKNKVGKEIFPPKGSSWRRPFDTMKKLSDENRIWWGVNGDAEFPMEKKFLSEVKDGVVNRTWWPYEFAGSTRNASAEMKSLFDGKKDFDTPKPERLIQRILQIATNPGDLVLDSFLGSGTTAAVAHKMGRRWIGIELGDHCYTHCLPRLKKVIDGEDEGGITYTQKKNLLSSCVRAVENHSVKSVRKRLVIPQRQKKSGLAAADSVFTSWPPALSRRTTGAILSSIPATILKCWQKPCASWKASPMRPIPMFSGSRATARNGISSTLPHKRWTLPCWNISTTVWVRNVPC